MEGLGRRIAWLLGQKGMRQTDLAFEAGLSEVTVSRYIRGERTPGAEELLRIAEALNVSTDFLLTGESGARRRIGIEEFINVRNVIKAYSEYWREDEKEILIGLLKGE